MKVKSKFLQMGGTAPEQAAPEAGAQGGQASPEDQLMQLAQQLLQQIGPEGCAMLVEILTQMLQSAGGAEQAPQGAPTYARKGGKLISLGRR